MDFGDRLRELRIAAHLSQRELARRVEIDYTYLSKIENGRVGPPSEAVLNKLAYALADALGHDATDLAYDLILLAGKFPSDLSQTLAQHPQAISYLRSLAGDARSAADWRRILAGDDEEPG